MEWKYWKPRADWEGSRSFLLERDSKILAHGAAWPMKILCGSETIPSFFLIDWAANAALPGAGVSLMRRMAELVQAVCVFGGTEIARRTHTAMGFRPLNEVQVFAKPLRPIRQMLTHQTKDWRIPARLLRNTLWSFAALPDVTSGRKAVLIPPGDIERSGLPWPSPEGSVAVFQQDPALLRYLSECRAASSELYVVQKSGEAVGYFCLFYVPGQARIADAWVASRSLEDWRQLYGLATQAALGQAANEIVAFAALPAAQRALQSCGYQLRQCGVVKVYDPGRVLPQDACLNLQMVHGDAAFLHSGTTCYLT
jgi:hypothetical protein